MLLFTKTVAMHAVNNSEDQNSDTLLNNPGKTETDTISQLSFENIVNQDINYIAPLSGYVYLVFSTNNVEPDNILAMNSNMKLNDGLFYSPMTAYGDTFKISIYLPKGSTIQYYFWITKSKTGNYQDFWDLQSSGEVDIDSDNTITTYANYTKIETETVSHVSEKSWVILIIIGLLYIGILLLLRKKQAVQEKTSAFEKAIFISISFMVFQSLARSEIIGVSPIQIFYDFATITKIFRASLGDIVYAVFLGAPFLAFLAFVKNSGIKKWLYAIYITTIILSSIYAFTNIKTVLYLGKPLNYQWLYYSDFLLSDDSKNAVSSNLSLTTIVNLFSFCASMLLFSGLLWRINRFIKLKKNIQYISLGVFIMLVIVIAFKSFKTETTWNKGQSENAIVSMIKSIVSINTGSSFFTAEIPDALRAFDPTTAVNMEDPILLPENHTVKNIVFVILESAGAVYFDGYGGNFNLSPNLNRYSEQALSIESTYAHAPATNRSLVSLLGSIYPYISYKSLTQESPQLDHPTLSSVLKKEGYRTSFFSSANLNFQNCREFLSNRDFDDIRDFSMIDCSDKFKLDSENYIEGDGIDDMCLASTFTSWLDEDTTKHFFSLLWTVQGHYPYYFSDVEEDFGVTDINFNRYLNALKHNDKLVGRLMKELEWRELDKNTLVVVVGDHGEAFGQHGQYGHGTALYEENIRVPLYFINGTLFHGQRKNDIAGLKDIASTSLSVVGVEIPDEWQGRDLLRTNSEETFFFAPWSDYLFGYRNGNMKFIFNESLKQVEVYDLNGDRDEKVNLSPADIQPEIDYARNRVAAWVQFQVAYLKQKMVVKR